MNQDDIISLMLTYQINDIEKTDPVFANLPICPFAKKARLDDKIDFLVCDLTNKEILCNRIDKDFKETLWCVHINKNMPLDQLDEIKEALEFKYPDGQLVFFTLHPSHYFQLGKIYTRLSPYPNILIQKLDIVNQREKKLRKTHYYDQLYGDYILFTKSSKTGIGTFASIEILKGTLISKLTGPIESVETASALSFQISKDLCMNSELIAKINHSCDPSCLISFEEKEITLVAEKYIPPLGELTFDYETTEEDLIAYGCDFKCLCGSLNCRGNIKGFFDKNIIPNWGNCP